MSEKIEIVLVEDSSSQRSNQTPPNPRANPTAPPQNVPSQPSSGSPANRPADPVSSKYEVLSLRAAILLLADRMLPRNVAQWMRVKTQGMDFDRDDDTQLGKFMGKLDSFLARWLKNPLKMPSASGASTGMSTKAASGGMQHGLGWSRPAAPLATGASTGAAAGGATAGAAAGVSVAATAAIVAGVVIVFAGLAYAAKKLMDAFSSEANRLSQFGGALAGAKAQIEVNQMERDFRRAERIGPQLAQMEMKRDQLSEAQHEVVTAIYELLLEASPLIKIGIDALTVIMQLAKSGLLQIKSIYQLLKLDPVGAFKSQGDSVNAQLNAFNTILNMALPTSPATTNNRWILDQNPFGNNPMPNQVGPQQQPNPFGGP